MNNEKHIYASDVVSNSCRFTMECGIYKAEVILDEDKNLQTVEVGSKGGYWNARLDGDQVFSGTEFDDYLLLLNAVKKKLRKLKEKEE